MRGTLFDLKNKTILITGASQGIGRRAVEMFAESGAKVVAVARSEEALKSLQKDFPSVEYYSLDLSEREGQEKLAKILEEKYPNVEVFLNTIGKGYPKVDWEQTDFRQTMNNWDECQKVNSTTSYALSYLVAKQMIASKIKGRIILVGSVRASSMSAPGGEAYSCAKASVHQSVKTMAQSLGKYGIRVNGVIPGLIETRMTRDALESGRFERFISNIPLSTIGRPEDFDGIFLLLSSEEGTRYLSGECIKVDGGVTAGFNL